MFSAHLSTYESLLYYLKKSLTDQVALKWFAKGQVENAAFNALNRLRNMDIHHEPLHTMIGMRYRITGPAHLFSSLNSKETHQHLQLSHEGVGFYRAALA